MKRTNLFSLRLGLKKTVFMLNNTSFLDTIDTNLLTTILYHESLLDTENLDSI